MHLLARRTLPLLLAAVVALPALAGCAKPEPPDIRGKITHFAEIPNGVAILVEGKVAEGTTYDKASVTVNKATEVVREGKDDDVGIKALSAGQTVEVWFTGPVAESYPVQAAAEKVVILE